MQQQQHHGGAMGAHNTGYGHHHSNPQDPYALPHVGGALASAVGPATGHQGVDLQVDSSLGGADVSATEAALMSHLTSTGDDGSAAMAGMEGHGSLSAEGTEDEKRRKKRPRQVLSCTMCVRRKTKCDKVVPCSACVKRGDPSVCMVEGADEKSTSRQPFALNEELIGLRNRVAILEGVVGSLLGNANALTGSPNSIPATASSSHDIPIFLQHQSSNQFEQQSSGAPQIAIAPQFTQPASKPKVPSTSAAPVKAGPGKANAGKASTGKASRPATGKQGPPAANPKKAGGMKKNDTEEESVAAVLQKLREGEADEVDE